MVEAEPTDEELCRRIGQRDAPAFDLLVERYQARAWRLARSISGNNADAHDVSQDAFIRLYESAERFDGRSRSRPGSIVSWSTCVSTIFGGINGGRNLSRSRIRTIPTRPLSIHPRPNRDRNWRQFAEPRSVNCETRSGVLSPNQRAALLLQVQEGCTSREIAEVLNCSENTARVHVHRAMAQLKKEMKKN